MDFMIILKPKKYIKLPAVLLNMTRNNDYRIYIFI